MKNQNHRFGQDGDSFGATRGLTEKQIGLSLVGSAAMTLIGVASLVASCASPGGDRSRPLNEAVQEQQRRDATAAAAAGAQKGDPLADWMQQAEAGAIDGKAAAAQPTNPPPTNGKKPRVALHNAPTEAAPSDPAPVAGNTGATIEIPGEVNGTTSPTTVVVGADGLPIQPATSPVNAAPVQDREELSRQLAAALTKDAEASSAPFPSLVRLAMIEALEPGSATATAAAEAKLTPREKEFVQAWRSLHAGAAKGLDASGDVAQLTKAAGEFSEKARAWETMRIARAVLCTKVEGFGVYNELMKYGDSYKFVAGRKQKFIVYTELDRFAATPVSRDGVQGFAVEMNQDLTLFHSSKDKDLAAWQKTGQTISDFSRNPRRDFFVVQIVELPDTLSIGSYTLKVTMTGKTGGDTAEAVIPIDIVADNSVMRTK